MALALPGHSRMDVSDGHRGRRGSRPYEPDSPHDGLTTPRGPPINPCISSSTASHQTRRLTMTLLTTSESG